MTKKELKSLTELAVLQTKTALQLVYDALNEGQRKKLLKNNTVASLLETFEVAL